ncbi:hypothetical protein [Pseudoduganella namucuonensis]|uniref:hypothetical protein n=1 Tax=Pseudoduganella namucuonensis TaxID=1035707 RepID=UPI0027D7DB3F|nr:hypothetical protein [Pseudoduganella namucuonensis]
MGDRFNTRMGRVDAALVPWVKHTLRFQRPLRIVDPMRPACDLGKSDHHQVGSDQGFLAGQLGDLYRGIGRIRSVTIEVQIPTGRVVEELRGGANHGRHRGSGNQRDTSTRRQAEITADELDDVRARDEVTDAVRTSIIGTDEFEDVVAGAAVQRVSACAAGDRVVARAAADGVVAIQAVDAVGVGGVPVKVSALEVPL